MARVLLGSRSAVRVLRIRQEHLLDRDHACLDERELSFNPVFQDAPLASIRRGQR